MTSPEMPADLARLAVAYGVATEYRDGRRRLVRVAPDVVIRILGLLEVDAGTAAQRRRELLAVAERERGTDPPATITLRIGGEHRNSKPLPGARELIAEDRSRRPVHDELPADLTPGWYTLLGTGDNASTV